MGGGLQGSTEQRQGPMGFTIPLYNSSLSPAVIDELLLVGGTKYAGPRLLRLAVLSTSLCGGAWPAHSSGTASHGLRRPLRRPTIGRAIGFTFTRPVPAGFPGAAEVAGPPPRGCWVMTEVIIHYHVGTRHYTATDPYELAVAPKTPRRILPTAPRTPLRLSAADSFRGGVIHDHRLGSPPRDLAGEQWPIRAASSCLPPRRSSRSARSCCGARSAWETGR